MTTPPALRVLHVAYSYYPDPVGGTEIYVECLARLLGKSGIECVICAPGATDRSYIHDGLRVHRFAGRSSDWPLEYCYDEGDAISASAFAAILAAEKPDVVHIHALNSEVSPRLAREAAIRNVPLVFTYHAATATCQIGSLLRWGRQDCNGELNSSRCAACNLHRLGMPPVLAVIAGHAPLGLGDFLQRQRIAGPAATALRMNQLVARRHDALRSFLHQAERIVAPSRWVSDLLIANDVPTAKILLSSQGLAHGAEAAPACMPRLRRSALDLAVLARLDPTKGVDVLVDALAGHPELDVALDIYCIPPSRDGGPYAASLERRIANDPRIRILAPIPHNRVTGTLSGYDALALPSQVLETGPLAALEAFAAGIPVIGSDLGGIRERVAHGKDGLLVPPSDRAAWADALRRLISEAGLLQRLTSGVLPPRRMEAVAGEMEILYRELASGSLRQARRPEIPAKRVAAPAVA